MHQHQMWRMPYSTHMQNIKYTESKPEHSKEGRYLLKSQSESSFQSQTLILLSQICRNITQIRDKQIET